MELLGVGAKTKSNLWTHDATRIPLPVYGVMLSVTAQQLTLGSGVLFLWGETGQYLPALPSGGVDPSLLRTQHFSKQPRTRVISHGSNVYTTGVRGP